MESLVHTETQETLEQKVARLEQENALLREENLKLKEEAYKDPLTGIMNRRSFDKTVSSMFRLKTPEGLEEKRQKEGKENNVCFVMIDLDRFKDVNDKLGHLAGDEVLKEVASMLEVAIRKTDIIARWGGEEIVIILREASPYEAAKKANMLRQIISGSPVTIPSGEKIKVTMSVGVAFGNNITSDPEVLKKLADEAMYHSKESGKDIVSVNDGHGNIRLFGEIEEKEWANFES